MSGQRWELKTVEVVFPTEIDTVDLGGDREGRWELRKLMPTFDDTATQQMLQAYELAAQGWELVSVVPVNKGYLYVLYDAPTGGGAGGTALTNKLILFFKRPLDD